MGQYSEPISDVRHVFRDPQGRVLRRYRDLPRDHRGWLGTMPATNGWWWDGILLAKGAHVTIPCIGWFSDEDWRVMQALGVVCFARDTAAY